MPQLTPKQEQVLALLADGRTLAAAAKESEVDRSTVLAWRRNNADFRESFAIAQYEQTLYWREQLESLGSIAIISLRQILTDDSGSVRMRAAVAVLDRIAKAGLPQPELSPKGGQSRNAPRPLEQPSAQNAQPCTTDPPQEPRIAPEPLSLSARTIPHNLSRNTACPCGSGLKYKRCCLAEPKLQFAAQAA